MQSWCRADAFLAELRPLVDRARESCAGTMSSAVLIFGASPDENKADG